MKDLKKFYLLFTSVLLLSSIALAQNEDNEQTDIHVDGYIYSVSNGHFWETLDKQSKIFFLIGIDQGMALLFQEISLKGEKHCNTDEVLEAINSLSSSGFRFSDYVDQIDNFYEDKANIKIPIIEAYRFTQLKIKGVSKEQLENGLSLLRQKYNN